MSTTDQPRLQSVTRERWGEIITNQPADERLPPLVKRHDHRQGVDGVAKLTLANNIVRTCSLLQVSEGGIMVRSPKEITVGTPISIEAYVEDEAVLLSGKVMHCTATVGAFKVGIQLDFDD